MEDMIMGNPGFTGRFPATLHFQDWSCDALSDLVISQLMKGPPPDAPYVLEDREGIKKYLCEAFQTLRMHNPAAFSNARDAVQMRKFVKMEYSSNCGGRIPFPSVTCMMQLSPSQPRCRYVAATVAKSFLAVQDFEAAARVFLSNRPSQTCAARRPVHGQHDGGSVAGAEVAAEQSMHAPQRMERFHQQQQQEDSSSLPSTLSDHDDKDLDFLKEHLEAVDERLKSATGLHETSLRAERDRTITMIQAIAALKRKNDAAAAKKKLEEEKKRLALLTKIRERMRKIDRCPAGFAWRWEGNQFHCEGGSHYATAEQLQVSAEDCANFFSKTGVFDV
jgi:hypothetical protein